MNTTYTTQFRLSSIVRGIGETIQVETVAVEGTPLPAVKEVARLQAMARLEELGDYEAWPEHEWTVALQSLN